MGFLHHLFHSHHGRHGHHGHHHRGGRHGHRGHHRHHHHYYQQRQGGPFDDEGGFANAASARQGGAPDGERFDGIDRIEYLAQKAARRLDLDNEQLARLKMLIERVQQQREAVRGGDWLQDAAKLFDTQSFDRAAAQALVDARIALLQAAAPPVLDAVAGFYDALDVEQQQVLRFFIRLGRRARDRREGEEGQDGGHDSGGAGTDQPDGANAGHNAAQDGAQDGAGAP